MMAALRLISGGGRGAEVGGGCGRPLLPVITLLHLPGVAIQAAFPFLKRTESLEVHVL
jgi:hypothetical protein